MATARKKTISDGTIRWYAVYIGGDGRQHTGGGHPTKAQALKTAQRLEAEAKQLAWVSPTRSRMTFSTYVSEHYWPTTIHLELSTRAAYRSYLDKHFIPTFGDMPMSRISPSTVQDWVNQTTPRLSARSVRKYHAFLSRVFSRAVIDKVISANPAGHTVLPKVITRGKRIITPTEFDTLLAALPAEWWPMVLLEIETGLRWGELIALQPADLDPVLSVVHVQRTWVEVSKKNSPTGERMNLKPYPKDDEARDIRIERATLELVLADATARGITGSMLLFPTGRGTPLSRNTFRTRVWVPALEKAGFSRTVRFHDLRSAHASWLLAGGADLGVVMDRLGHRQITTTQQYLGTLPDSGDRALAALRRVRGEAHSPAPSAKQVHGGAADII